MAVVEREGVARVEGQGEHAEAAVTMSVVVATTAAAAAVGAAERAIKGRFLPWVVVAEGRRGGAERA